MRDLDHVRGVRARDEHEEARQHVVAEVRHLRGQGLGVRVGGQGSGVRGQASGVSVGGQGCEVKGKGSRVKGQGWHPLAHLVRRDRH